MEQKTFPIEIGQSVIMEPIGNYARRGSPVIEGTIVSIKRKYFYVKDKWNHEHKFAVDDFSYHGEDCNAAYVLWETKEAFKNELKRRDEADEIRKFLGSYRFGLNALSNEDVHAIFKIVSKYLHPELTETT